MSKLAPASGNSIDAIFKVVDDAAADLMRRLDEVQTDDNGKEIRITIGERTKAFEAVVAYAAIRAKVEPPSKKMETSAFDKLKRDFDDSDAPERRARGRPRAANGTETGHA